jgi:glutamine cyclotransferase
MGVLGAVVLAVAAVAACARGEDTGVEVVASYPHDPAAFTQGLAIENGQLYESTGQYGASSLRLVDLESGKVERLTNLPRNYFGEGIAIAAGRIYQLTWQSRTGFVYDLETFEPLARFSYAGEGWGITFDGTLLIVSDGTSTLRFLDPTTMDSVRRVTVQDEQGSPVTRINELEFVDGEVWANIWYDDRIARISPDDGRVLGWLDLAHVYPAEERGREQVLNGIAYDRDADRIYVTGKNWPRLYEIRVR